MASDNETVAEVIAEFQKNIELMRRCECVGVSLWNCMKFRLRIEVAHNLEVAELQQRLKVAEDALAKLRDLLVASVHDGTIDPYDALQITENALAGIRGEGGAK